MFSIKGKTIVFAKPKRIKPKADAKPAKAGPKVIAKPKPGKGNVFTPGMKRPGA